MIQHQLIEACKQNDRRAQLKLYNKYSEGMYYVAYRFMKDRFEAEDAMQEAFIKAFAKLNQFTGEVSFGAWLKKIVINKCIDKLKAKKLELVAINEQVLSSVDENDNWKVEEGVSLEQIKKCMENLPEKYRYPLMLFLMEGYDHEEISEIMEISQVASRTLVHRGKKKLQEELKSQRHGTGY
ncbi:MAG: RNA polymerase sigma factor [Salegentibacter sp.]|uniref:RNA polymerase sigma-70 factor, ECF subfamily n=1 Tax=Salegentibacter flavus TaxID=287099 RepID=A0A1I4ZGH6_9FLAO|nr:MULTISPECIES: RNA polymerase sigma factor [Salegentibacter]MDR9456750.1 RNA polymerase sigma factor [Salegentibacter sp.]SFN49371.1 RNA polymerase sigma-70 factor, ECF subfamily [Salegentibacter flavus]